ncbi:MAG: alkaline phosphatase family protein [Candidatus Woesearchaeota archaeon]
MLPNYKNGSLANLMSSIKKSFGGKHLYNELKVLPSNEIKTYKNVVLLIIDGLGYNYIKKRENTILKEHLKSSITSVFPATTASVIPMFYSGYPAQQSGMTGWYMFLKELGVITTTLKFNLRIKSENFGKMGIDIKDIFNFKPFVNDMKAETYSIKPKKINGGDLTQFVTEKTNLIGFTSMNGLFNQINKVVKLNNKKKYIYAYWDTFDSLSHKFGPNSKEVKNHYLELCNKIEKLSKKLEKTNTKLIITADHGFIETTKQKYIELSQHPKLKECLTMPLCGDPRTVYCYVKPSKMKEFESYVKTKLKHCCHLIKSEEAVKKNLFGLYTPNKKIFDRIGDYILIMKDEYVLRDSIINSKKEFHPGVHSGTSENEMLVPLIVFDFK